MRRRVLMVLALGLAGGLALLGVATPLLGNVWLSATDGDFRVPQASSLIAFRATQMNPGSGGWWLYGEDGERYYSSDGDPDHVVVMERSAAAGCAGFDPHDITTWCGR